MGQTKLLFLALDAFDETLVRRWAGEGLLPGFRDLFARALNAPVPTPAGFTVAVWSSLYSGALPGGHGRYYYDQLVPGTYQTRILPASRMACEPFWFPFSRAGRRVAVIDGPKTELAGPVNGLQLVDWGCHDPDIHEAPRSWPVAAAGELTARFGADPVHADDFGGRGPSDVRRLRQSLLANVERKTRLCETLLAEQDWDLFFVCLDDAHQCGHLCWSLHDPAHPLHDPARAAEVGDPIRDVYAAIDAALPRLLAAAGPAATVLVYSSTGMGPSNHGYGLLDPILRRLEAVSDRRSRLHGALKAGWDHLPSTVQRPLNHFKSRFRESLLEPERARRRCFALPMNDDGGGIRVNLAGREPQGRVGAEDYDAFCNALTADLLAMRNLDTGAPLLRQVYRVRECHPGPLVDALPDLAMEWNTDAPSFAAVSAKTGVVRQTYSRSRSGSHLPRGWLAAVTPGMRPGRLNRDLPVTGIAPTLGRLFDVPLPQAQGAPIPELLG